ncbi:uncharacterized protein LOC144909088 [Branchiostoma floridae x Branchiostoma belcheri]
MSAREKRLLLWITVLCVVGGVFGRHEPHAGLGLLGDCDPVTYDLCQEVMSNTTDMWGMLGNFSDDVMDGNDTFVDMMSVIESGCHDNASLLVCSACLERPLCQSLCDDVMEQCDDILAMFDVNRQCEGLPNELDPVMQCISRGVCAEGEMECWSPGLNGTEPHCVNASLACDGDWDCPFGEDEDHCEGRCTSWQFQCDQDFPDSGESGSGNSSSPECLHPWQVCDGVRDCSSGEDERDCGSVCLPGEKECWSPGGNASCVDSGLVCDGVRDCFLGEDEDDCHNGTLFTHNCTEGEVECFSWAGNMTCVNSSLRCDGNWDCPFGEDEDLCDGQCSSWQFQCDVDFPTGNKPSPTGPSPSPPECIDPWQPPPQDPRDNRRRFQDPRDNRLRLQDPRDNRLRPQDPRGNLLRLQDPRDNRLRLQNPRDNPLRLQDPRDNRLCLQDPRDNLLSHQDPRDDPHQEGDAARVRSRAGLSG